MIKYKVSTKGNSKVLPQLGKVADSRAIARIIEEKVGIPSIRTMSVLNALAVVVKECLADARPVRLDDIGTLRPALAEGEDGVRVRKLSIYMDSHLREQLKDIELEEIPE